MSLETHFVRASILTIKRLIASVLLVCAAVPFIRSAIADSDILYVGNASNPLASNDLVLRFNANTGAAIPGGNPSGVFRLPGSNDLDGPRGILRLGDQLLVASQNQSKDGVPGQILRYKLFDGRPDGAFVPSGPKSPFTPDAIISWRGVVYAADISISDTPQDNLPLGRLLAYDARTGKLLRQFNPNTFPTNFPFPIKFHPRGLVIGPNGLLYVSSLPDVQLNPALRLGGQILVFDPETFDFLGVFIDDAGGVNALNRPDALVFSPDGKLYVASFRANPTDSDSIRIYDGHTGVFLDEIELYTPPSPPNARAFAQGILFGPGGKLFVPISGNDPTTTGRIRRYDVQTKSFDVFADVTRLADALVPHLRQNQSRDTRLRPRRRSRRPQARLNRGEDTKRNFMHVSCRILCREADISALTIAAYQFGLARVMRDLRGTRVGYL